MELVVPKAEPGIGKVILSPTEPDLIAGVEIKPFSSVAGRPRIFSGNRALGARLGGGVSG